MTQQEIADQLSARFGDDIRFSSFRDQMSAHIHKEKLLEVCSFLKSEPTLQFDMLSFVAGVDGLPRKPRFEMVYQLYSTTHIHRFRLKTLVEENEDGWGEIESVAPIWITADWHERETAEMYGIRFLNHPDPRTLLLPEEWTIHPLRKDFPLRGTEQDTPDLPHPMK